jgi:hypothetical protein
MTAEALIILVVRVLGSLPVLRWALAGAVIAILVDLSDLFLRDWIDLGGIPDYQSFDKWLDQVYLLAFLVVALRWEGVSRTIAIVLYAFRLVGFALFEVTEERAVLFLLPNVFEFWFLFVAATLCWRPGFRYTARNTTLALVALTALKEAHEYALHVGRWLDEFSSTGEFFDAIRDWLVGPFS